MTMEAPRFTWSWIEMCGPAGMVPWYPSKYDVGACFQHLFLEIPVLILFAMVSAYFYGSLDNRRAFHRHQKWTIKFRTGVSLIIALTPVTKNIVGLVYTFGMFRPVDYLTSGVEVVAWFVHTCYVHSLRHQQNYHGPVLVRVLWTLTAVLSIINLRSHVLTYDSTNLASDLSYGFSIAVVILQVLYGLTYLSLSRQAQSNLTLFDHERTPLLQSSFYQGFREDLDPEYLGVAMENATFTSKLIFYWVNPLMQKGADKKLRTCDDLYDLPPDLSSSYLCAKLHSAIEGTPTCPLSANDQSLVDVEVITPSRRRTLVKALHSCFGVEFYAVGLLKFGADALGFGGPLILNQLVLFIEDKTQSTDKGLLWAGALCLICLIAAFLNVHFNFIIAKIGLKFRGALISVIYKKTLNLSGSSINKFSMGEIVNFMSTDTDRIVNSCPSFHALWSIPFQLAVTFYLLYAQVGIAFLAGVVFTLVLIPINKVIASKIGELSTRLMDEKDQRVASMAEILRGIRVIKVHVWEEFFLDKILNIRQRELKHLKGRKYLDALCVYFWATTPVAISILTFVSFSLMGRQLTAATVFTTVALLNMLIAPLNAFPWVLNGLTEAWVSLRRIQRFIDLDDLVLRNYFTPVTSNDNVVFDVKEGVFQWAEGEDVAVLTQPSTVVVRKPGKGKQLVRASIQEEAAQEEGPSSEGMRAVLWVDSLTINRGELVGVVGSVGSGKSTLLAALLGELHRPLGVVAMDNMDTGVALVTQLPWLQRGTLRDNILFGKSFDNSRYKAVLEACCLSQDLEALHGGDLVLVGEGGMTLSGGQRARVAIARAVYQDKETYLLDDVLSAVDVQVARWIYNKVICGLLKDKTRIFCTNQVHLLGNADWVVQLEQGIVFKYGRPCDVLPDLDDLSDFDTESMHQVQAPPAPTEPEASPVLDEEVSDHGAVKLGVYRRYWTSMGHVLALFVLTSMVLMQSSRNVTDLWLSWWVSQDTQHNITARGPDTTTHYLTVYVLLAVVNTLFTLFRAFLFAYGGIHAADTIHSKLLSRVGNAKVTFFDVSPIGRILNRFSSDTYTVDDSLPFILNILLAQAFGLVGALVVTMYGLPWLCLLVAPLVPIYHYIQAMYRHSSRELKRLSSVTLSPVYSHFNETLQGLTTIRAFRCLVRFKRVNEDFLECNQKAQFAGQSANQWLALRLQLIGVVLVSGVGIIAVLQHEFDVVDPALVGLAVAYALSVTGMLNGVVTSFAEVEKEMVALERVGQYVDEVETEVDTGNYPPYAWPSQGVIVFQSVYLKYREHLAPSLNGISFETRPAEKVGVVGRTGAGKSSLITALLRLVSVSSGSVSIDTVNVNHLALQGLRIAVIPQDPFLFKGSVRDNVDPLEEFSDAEVWTALDKCHISSLVRDLGGLAGEIAAGGRNLSQGQRQLLCLVRAVLRNAKIVCVDEATASVDNETDKKVQQTVRACFRQSTVLTIAHRISTVMDCDRVLVLRDGEVIEFDTPVSLAHDKTSYFYQLCHQDM